MATRAKKHASQEKRKCSCVSEQWDKWYGSGIRIFEEREGDTWECLQCGEMRNGTRQRGR